MKIPQWLHSLLNGRKSREKKEQAAILTQEIKSETVRALRVCEKIYKASGDIEALVRRMEREL